MSPRLFLQIYSIEARRAMSYRVTFWVHAVVGGIAGFGIPYFLWSSIFATTGSDRIGGYDFSTMVLYYVIVTFLGRVVRGPDMGLALAQEVYDGSLTRYLIYPARLLPFKYAQHLGSILPSLLQALLFSPLFILFLDLPPDTALSPLSLTLGGLSVIGANLLYFLMALPIHAVAFWAENVWSLAVLLRFLTSFLGGAMVPLSLLPGWSTSILSYSPLPHLYSLPVNTLLGHVSAAQWLHEMQSFLIWVALLALLSAAIWRRALRSYTGVGM